MSGVEALGVISSVISMIDATVKICRVISDASDLPPSFRDVAKRLDLTHDTLANIASQLRKREQSESSWKAISHVVKGCEKKAEELDAIFRKALPGPNTSRIERLPLAIRMLGRGSKVDSLMDSIDKDLSILTLNFVTQSATTESQVLNPRQPSSQLAAPLSHTAVRDALLKELDWRDPQLAKDRIERSKGGLYDAASDWILSHPSYKQWKDKDTRLLWVRGAAGKGKTMLLMRILKDLRARRVQHAITADIPSVFFFCQNKEPESNNATSVLKGLIASLLIQDSQLAAILKSHYDRLGKEAFDSTKRADTFDTLATIFRDLAQSSKADHIHLAVDALDECDSGRSDLVKFVTDTSLQLDNLKWVVTSRHHINVTDSLALNLEVTHKAVDQGIKAYISKQASRMPALASDPDLSASIEHKLFDKAEGTFLWVDQVLRLMQDCESYRLEELIDDFPSDLTQLYGRMMHDLDVSGGRYRESCFKVLRVVTLAERPLNVRELQILSGLVDYRRVDLEQAINRCGSFIVLRPETDHVYPIHQSAIEFLLGEKSLDMVFPLGKATVHRTLVENSFQAMSGVLKRDVYGLADPGALISEFIRPPAAEDPLHAIDYSCTYWISHACAAASDATKSSSEGVSQSVKPSPSFRIRRKVGLGRKNGDGKAEQADSICSDKSKRLSVPSRLKHRLGSGRFGSHANDESNNDENKNNDTQIGEIERGLTIRTTIYDSIASFIRRYLLCWLEAVSLLGHMGQVALALGQLQMVLEADSMPENDAKRLIRDSYRFFVQHQVTISEAPLQAYVSALLFSPRNSIVRGLFSSEEPHWVVKKPEVAEEWTARPPVLNSANVHGECCAISFSFDGSRLATIELDMWNSDRKTISIHEIYSGIELCLLGVDEWSDAEAFERDESDNFQPKRTHSFPLGEDFLKFSFDGVYIAWGSPSMIRIWNVETGAKMGTLKPASLERFRTMAFCRDEKQVISISNTGMIRLWDLGSMQELVSAAIHVKNAGCVDISPDGCLVAWSGGSDNAIRVRKIRSQQHPQRLKGHSQSVNRLLFSRNSHRLMSWSSDAMIRVWDLASGKTICVHKTHPGVTAGAISADGTLIAICYHNDDRVDIIDTDSGNRRCEILNIDRCWNHMIMEISPDKRYLALADPWLNVWDTTYTTKIDGAETGKTTSMILLSLDDRYVAMASTNGVRFWEMDQVGTDCCSEFCIGRYDKVDKMAFSSDASFIAIYGRQGSQWSVTVWATSSCRSKLVINRDDRRLDGDIQLSPRGNFLVLWSLFERKIWDVQSGKLLDRDLSSVHHRLLRFSQDEVYYAINTGHGVQVHEITSGRQVCGIDLPEHVHEPDFTKSLTFSPNNRYVAFLTHLSGPQVWEWSMSRKMLRALDTGPENMHPASLIISPDSNYLLLSFDSSVSIYPELLSAVQIWDIEQGTNIASIDTGEVHYPYSFQLLHFRASEDPLVHYLCTNHGDLKFVSRSPRDNTRGKCTIPDSANASAPTLTREILLWAKDGPWLYFQGQRMLRIPSEYDNLGCFGSSRDGLSFYLYSDEFDARILIMRLSPDPWRSSSIDVVLP